MLQLNTISPKFGSTRGKKRLGRGSGSGRGTTSGKGMKGQLSRTGGTSRPGFEGGQTPFYRRLPKRGFNNVFRIPTATINVCDLERLDPKALPEVSLASLRKAKIIRSKRYQRLTVLGNGDLKKSFVVKAHRFSPSAKDKISKAGGKAELV